MALLLKNQLDKFKESIDTINGMSSFSGKAAKEAKNYFGELHLTLLESFRGLFDDLEGNLQQHIEAFGSKVDSSDSAVIKSNYLQEVKEDVNDLFEDLEKQDEIIHDTIQEVSDISSASPPSFSDVDEWKKKAIKKLKEVDEDLSTFNGEGDETDVKAIMDQIETVMNNAKTSEGKARFADFEGASEGSTLAKLKGYIEDKKEERNEELDQARKDKNVAVKNMDEDSQEILHEALEDLENEEISKNQYDNILADLKGLQGEGDQEEKLSDDTTEYINRDSLVDELGNNTIVAYVGDALENKGKKTFRRGEIVKMMSGKLPENGPPNSLMEKGNKLLKYGKYAGGAFMGLSAAYGMYDDMYHHDKTSGEAVAHSASSIGAGILGDAAGYGAAYGTALFLGASNPVGWATLGGIAVGSALTWGFNELYDKNFMGLQDEVDKIGKKVDEFTDKAGEKISEFTDNVGEAVSTLNAINPFS